MTQRVPATVFAQFKLDWWNLKDTVPREEYIANRAAEWAMQNLAATRREALLEAVEACKNAELEECVDLSDVLYNAACCACAASIEQLIKETQQCFL